MTDLMDPTIAHQLALTDEARAANPDAAIYRPLPDGTVIVFPTARDALGHVTAQVEVGHG